MAHVFAGHVSAGDKNASVAGQEPLPYLTSLTYTSGNVGGISQGTGNTPTQNGIGGLVTRSELRPAATLKPERSKEFEAGVDLGFFKDRADASVTWYNKKSSDIILLQPLNPSIGFFQEGANAATMRNRPPSQRGPSDRTTV